MDKKMVEFLIYIINETAYAHQVSPSRVYNALDEVDCINCYLVPYYDVLHTMGTQAIIQDIESYLQSRGVIL